METEKASKNTDNRFSCLLSFPPLCLWHTTFFSWIILGSIAVYYILECMEPQNTLLIRRQAFAYPYDFVYVKDYTAMDL